MAMKNRISRIRRRRKPREHLPNFHRVTDFLFRGGQPTLDGIAELKKLGVKTIINFRDARERVHRERRAAEEHGIRFINFHLSNWWAARDEHILQIIELIRDEKNHPVFIHCKRGADRTGTVVAVFRMLVEGWSALEANAEAKKHGIGWWQVWMKDYIRDFQKRVRTMGD